MARTLGSSVFHHVGHRERGAGARPRRRVPLRGDRRQLPQRRRGPCPGRRVDRPPPLALPRLPHPHRLVRQRPGPLLAPAPGAVPDLPARHLLPLPAGGTPRGRGRTGGGLPARALARRAGRVRVRGHAPRALLHRSRHLAAPPRHDRAAAPRRGRALGPGAHGGAHVPLVARRRGGRLALLRRRVPRGREGPQEGGARIRRRVAAGGDRRLGRPGRPPPGGAARLRAGHGDRARTHRDGTWAARTGPAPDPSATEPVVAPAPEAPPDPDADWVPPRNAVPFGPFLAAGALEWLWLQGWLAQAVPAMSIFR